MNHKVIKRFRDKETKKAYRAGEDYQTESQERAEELIELGYLKKKEKNPLLDKNVAGVKAMVSSDLSQTELKSLLQDEKEGDNRKGVIEYIESLLKDTKDESGKIQE